MSVPNAVGDDGLASELRHAIEDEVIPRLLLAYHDELRAGSDMPPEAELDLRLRGDRTIHPSEVVAFADLLIEHAPQVAFSVVMAHVRQGFPLPLLLLELCAPAARELGDRWLRDECSFCDVTVGLSSLEQVLLRCSGGVPLAPFDPSLPGYTRDRTALFTSLPGNQHTFGLMIVKELFRGAGWAVHDPGGPDRDAILDVVRCTHFDLLGLSVSKSKDLHACQSLVKACKSESLNPKLLVVVGGHGIQSVDVTESMLGADVIARDGDEALATLERMIADQHARGPLN